MLPAGICAIVSQGDAALQDCESPVLAACVVNIVLAIGHSGFALYLQSRLVSGFAAATAGGPGGAAPRGQEMDDPEELIKQAMHIVLYDVGFCIYIVVFVGALAFEIVALVWIGGCHGLGPLPVAAAGLMCAWGWLAIVLLVVWWCMLSCVACCCPKSKAPATVHHPGSGVGSSFPGSLGHFVMGQVMGSASQRPGVAQAHPVPGQYSGAQPQYGQQPQAYAAHQAPAMQAMRPPAQQYGQPAPAAQGQPATGPTTGQTAAKVAGGGLFLAGQGLSALGRMVGGGDKGGRPRQ